MAAKALPAQDVLLQLLSYDPETGKLFWKERGRYLEWEKRRQRSLLGERIRLLGD